MCQNSEDSFSKVIEAVEKPANSTKVAVEIPRTVKRSVFRAGSIPGNDSAADYYCIQLFLPLLDGRITHLNDRFGLRHENHWL
jgi:hypothetical protein